MVQTIAMSVPGAIGTDAGAASDGVLVGQLTAIAPTKVLLKALTPNALVVTDDGGLYADDTADFASAAADDVQPLPNTPAVDDAFYIGHATNTFASVTMVIGTQGVATLTVTWEYWNGTAWTALAGVTDGTTGFTAAAGSVDLTFTLPVDWAKNTVDNTNAYWIRGNVSAYTSITTPCTLTSGFLTTTAAAWTDDTTDFGDAGAGDVELLPSQTGVGDGLYIGHTEKFCKVKVTTSQAATGTHSIALKYWDGAAWTAVPAATVDDDSAGWVTAAGTMFIHFAPPTDWVANTAANGPNGETGFFVVMELTGAGVTQQPLGTQGWVFPLKTGASGIPVGIASASSSVSMVAQTASGSTKDSTFVLVNTTTGAHLSIVWTKADPTDSASGSLSLAINDELALVQVTEDATTEFADISINVEI